MEKFINFRHINTEGEKGMAFTCNKEAAKGVISRILEGTEFQVRFTKKDGSERVLKTIKGLTPNLTGAGKRYSDEEKGFISLIDIEAEDWRVCNLATLNEIKVNDQYDGEPFFQVFEVV
jgi:hypothetical protein